MTDIFISYAREDEARIMGFVAALEGQGWSVFWDRRIPAGETWRSYIGKALDEARCVLVAWSQYSVNSNWVIEEADDGKQRGVLVPVLLDPVAQPRGFREMQAADLTSWQPDKSSPQFDLLIQDLATRLRGAPVISKKQDLIVPPKARPKRSIIALAAILALVVLSIGGYLVIRPAPKTPSDAVVPQEKKSITQATPITPDEPGITQDKKSTTQVTPITPDEPGLATNLLQSTPPLDFAFMFTLRAVIDDPDGYTNVRRLKSASSEIVTKVFEGEVFYTYEQEGNWWEIKTKDGKIGYMYKDRINILRP
jgi:hypothetical protein